MLGRLVNGGQRQLAGGLTEVVALPYEGPGLVAMLRACYGGTVEMGTPSAAATLLAVSAAYDVPVLVRICGDYLVSAVGEEEERTRLVDNALERVAGLQVDYIEWLQCRARATSGLRGRPKPVPCPASVSAQAHSANMRAKFEKYNVSGSGHLATEEVHKVVIDLGYVAPDEEYLKRLKASFGRSDADGNKIELEEFSALWEALDGDESCSTEESTEEEGDVAEDAEKEAEAEDAGAAPGGSGWWVQHSSYCLLACNHGPSPRVFDHGCPRFSGALTSASSCEGCCGQCARRCRTHTRT